MQVAKFFRQISQKLKPPQRNYTAANQWKPPTMNDLPGPAGNWKTDFDKNQVKYNRHLIIGIVITVATLTWGQLNGQHEFYSDIPDKPAEISMYK